MIMCITSWLKMTGKDKFFKFVFFLTIMFMGVVFFTNIERRVISLPQVTYKESREEKEDVSAEGESASASIPRGTGEKKEIKVIFEKVNIERIKKLIKEDKLSDKEAMFYRVIENE